MKMSTSTAMEIFSNPDDLMFTIGQGGEEKGFSFGIFRGPGHDFKPLLISSAFAETRVGALESLEEVLEIALQTMIKLLEEASSIISRTLNPENRPIDSLGMLNHGLINRILERLKTESSMVTYELFVTEV